MPVALHGSAVKPTVDGPFTTKRKWNRERLEQPDFKVRCRSTDIEVQAYDCRGWCRPESPRG